MSNATSSTLHHRAGTGAELLGLAPAAPSPRCVPTDVPAEVRAAPPSPLDDLRLALTERTAVVAVVGLGYVGLPLLLAVGDAGFGVVGIDVDDVKVDALRRGSSYVSDVSDADLDSMGRALLTTNLEHAVLADVVVVAVPTPLRDGSPDLSIVTPCGASPRCCGPASS